MPFNSASEVADCREICRKWGKGIEQVIIIGIDADGNYTIAGYGKTPKLCVCAEQFGKAALAGIQRLINLTMARGGTPDVHSEKKELAHG